MFVEGWCDDHRDEYLAELYRIGAVYYRSLNEMLLALADELWFKTAPEHERAYIAVYVHHRFSSNVLFHILGGNVDLIYGADADGTSDSGNEDDEG